MSEMEDRPFESKTVSRRQFLKLAGLTGATIGVGAGLGGLVAACGGTEETTTTAAVETTDTTATGGTETTVDAGAEMGDEVKLGFVTPLTGGLASFGVPDNYCVDRWKEFVGDGVVLGDGKKHAITFIVKDSQSDSNRAAQVTGDLINNDKVQVVMAASTPDTVNPVSDQCEANGMPCVTNDCPVQPYVFGRGGSETSEFQWTYHTFWGLEDVQATFLDMWGQVPINKVVGAMFPNDADGNAWRPAWEPVFAEQGYTEIDPGPFQNMTEDFTQQIAQFKKEGCELTMGVFIPPDFTNYWKQCKQQGFNPKIATFAKALLFPQSLEALGDVGIGLTTEVWWTPQHPFKSSLTGESCQEFADEFTTRTGQQWTQPLLHYIVFEHTYDALKRAADPMDPAAIVEAVKTTKIDTIGGPIDFTAPVEWGKVGPGHAHPNVYKTPVVGGQWLKGADYPYELVICSNAAADIVPTAAQVQPLA